MTETTSEAHSEFTEFDLVWIGVYLTYTALLSQTSWKVLVNKIHGKH